MANTGSWKVIGMISSRVNTGGSTAGITITGVNRTTAGFVFTLSAAPTGTDTLVIDWQLHQGS
jgi:hypothetical protein